MHIKTVRNYYQNCQAILSNRNNVAILHQSVTEQKKENIIILSKFQDHDIKLAATGSPSSNSWLLSSDAENTHYF